MTTMSSHGDDEMDARYEELAQRIGLGQSMRIPRLFALLADSGEAELLLESRRLRENLRLMSTSSNPRSTRARSAAERRVR